MLLKIALIHSNAPQLWQEELTKIKKTEIWKEEEEEEGKMSVKYKTSEVCVYLLQRSR